MEDNQNTSSQKTPATFTIFAVDRDGNPKASGGDLFDVFVREKIYLKYAKQFMDPAQVDEVVESKIPGFVTAPK